MKSSPVQSSSIPPQEAHLYTTRVESTLLYSTVVSVILFAYYFGISALERSLTFAWPVLAVAAVVAAVAVVFAFVCRAQRMFLQPGSPDYIGTNPVTSK